MNIIEREAINHIHIGDLVEVVNMNKIGDYLREIIIDQEISEGMILRVKCVRKCRVCTVQDTCFNKIYIIACRLDNDEMWISSCSCDFKKYPSHLIP